MLSLQVSRDMKSIAAGPLRARGPKGSGETLWDTPSDTPVLGDTLVDTPQETPVAGRREPRILLRIFREFSEDPKNLFGLFLTFRVTITHKRITEPNFIIFELFSVIPAL